MNPFQIVALVVIGVLFIATIAATVRGSVTRREGLAWALLWLAAGIAIARPGITAATARALGIGRGADLVLYCAVVVMLVGFLMVYARLRRLRRDVTLLVRHLAIRDAVNSAPANQPKTQPPPEPD
ncbi:MAG: DUF2304 family protein [Planctomycetota bacterium]|jgi:hypothetical protein